MHALVRDAREEDLEAIYRIEKRSYPPELWAPDEILRARFETFGIRVCETPSDIVGFYTSIPVNLDWNDRKSSIDKIKVNRNPHYTKWFDEFERGNDFNTLYVTSTAVEYCHQRREFGKSLVQDSLKMAEDRHLTHRASVLRVPGFSEYQDTKMSIGEYLEKIKSGRIISPTLGLYLSLGFTLGEIIPEYEQDPSSLNFGVFAFKKVQKDTEDQFQY